MALPQPRVSEKYIGKKKESHRWNHEQRNPYPREVGAFHPSCFFHKMDFPPSRFAFLLFSFLPRQKFRNASEFLTFELLHRLIDESRIQISSFEFSIEFIIIFVEKGFFNINSYVICRRYGTSVVNCRESRMRKLKGLNLTENSKNW